MVLCIYIFFSNGRTRQTKLHGHGFIQKSVIYVTKEFMDIFTIHILNYLLNMSSGIHVYAFNSFGKFHFVIIMPHERQHKL